MSGPLASVKDFSQAPRMFAWLFPSTCPLEPDERAWVDARVAWILRHYPHLVEFPVRLPLRSDFPEVYDGTRDAACALFRRIQSYMGLGREKIPLAFYQEGDGLDALRLHYSGRSGGEAGTAGKFTHGGGFLSGRPTIHLNEASLKDEVGLAATLAHELSHYLLLVPRPSPPGANESDHEPLTDLVTIFAGFGVFTANAIVRSTSKDEGLSSTWSVSRSGYLSTQLAGYALARYAQARAETKPAWRKHLSADPRAYFEQSRRFLRREPPLSLVP